MRRVYFVLYVVYLLVGLVARWQGWLHFDQVWFVDAARHLLAGDWNIYAFKASPDIAPPDGLAYSYSPLPALIMAPFVGLADLLGGDQAERDRLAAWAIAVPLLLADVLAMEQLRALLREWRPRYDRRGLLLGVAATLFLGGFLVVSAYRGHQEGLVLLFLLLALRITPRNAPLGGMLAGLALAAKHTVVLELFALGAVLLLPGLIGKGRERALALRKAGQWATGAIGTFVVFMIFPFLTDPDAVIYAFLTQEQRRGLLGPGLPVLLDRASAALGVDWHEAILRYSNVALVVVYVALVVLALFVAQRRGKPVGLTSDRLLALVALGGLLQLVLAKWVSGHYYQLPLALVLLWSAAREAPRLPLIGLGATIAFRSATQVEFTNTPEWRDVLIFAVFAWLTVVVVIDAFRDESRAVAEASLDAAVQT